MTLVERVARALCLHAEMDGRTDDGLAETLEGLVDLRWAEHADAARIAITALMEPTEEMVKAGAREHDNWSGVETIGALNAHRNARQVYGAMIAKALE